MLKADLKELWQDHQQKLYVFLRSRISNECDAKDLLQEIFLKLQTRGVTVKDNRKLTAWLYQVARNAVVDYYRKRGKTVELPEEVPSAPKGKNNWELISRCVRPFIEKLPKIYREVLLLSEIKGMSQQQVAKKLGISLASAKARILRGKQKLKKQFDDCSIFQCSPKKAEIHSDEFCKEERNPQ